MIENLGNRMKNYEETSQGVLLRKTPVIIRIDGKAFHTFTKGFNYPFDENLSIGMQYVGLAMMKQSQNAVFAYGQSDEVSVLMIDTENLNTETWFGNKVQKISSVSASIATSAFNNYLNELYRHHCLEAYLGNKDISSMLLQHKIGKALFDARCFNVPESDIGNYFYWRYRDAIRNSVNMWARSHFSHKEIQNLNVDRVKEKLKDNNTPWEESPEIFKSGWYINRENINIVGTQPVTSDKDIRELVLASMRL